MLRNGSAVVGNGARARARSRGLRSAVEWAMKSRIVDGGVEDLGRWW